MFWFCWNIFIAKFSEFISNVHTYDLLIIVTFREFAGILENCKI